MPSDAAQRAREKSNEVMAALKAGDTERANALLGKDESRGKLLPKVGWLKGKLNARKQAPAIQGEHVEVADLHTGSKK